MQVPTSRLFLALLLFALLPACSSTNAYIKANDRPAALQDAAFAKVLDFKNIDTELLNAAVFHATNEARIKHGRRRLAYHAVLEEAAQTYADRQAKHNFLAHEDKSNPGLVTPQDRVRAAGATNPYVAENLATTAGMRIVSGERFYVRNPVGPVISRTPTGEAVPRHTYASLGRSVVQQWLDSPGHRRNLLSADARALGCGSSFYMQDVIPSFVMAQNFQLYEPLKTN